MKRTQPDTAHARYVELQRLARARRRTTAEFLQLYVLEAFLRRLHRSAHRDRLVLKGGVLMSAFDLRRATRDLDLLALHVDNEPARIEQLVVDVASITIDDGVLFLAETIESELIRDEDIYSGVRVSLDTRLATARIKFSVDFNVGDPVVPPPLRTVLPALLGGENFALLAYPRAMVIAEKFVTALQRGRANTRWRDFADLFSLVTGSVDGDEVVAAFRAVASHRGVSLVPLAEALVGMPAEVQTRWATWRKRQAAEDRVPEDFALVLAAIDTHSRAWIALAASAG